MISTAEIIFDDVEVLYWKMFGNKPLYFCRGFAFLLGSSPLYTEKKSIKALSAFTFMDRNSELIAEMVANKTVNEGKTIQPTVAG